MADWMIAAADFVRTGGMDIANWHLARFLAQSGPVELMSHRVEDELARLNNVTATIVKRPFGMNMIGERYLQRDATKRSRQVLSRGGHVVANGGNCRTADINWVHYVHAAFTPITVGSTIRQLKTRYYHKRCIIAEKKAFEAARVIVCNSKLTARQVIENCNIPEEKTRIVYYGSNPDILKPISECERHEARALLQWDVRPRAVFVGALGDRRKGFDVLYTAWQMLSKDAGWDANLAVIGRGAELDAWKQRAKDHGMENRIEFLGFRSDVPKILAACDVMVHPARYEAYGLGVHEAVARGLPAIISARAGVSERIADVLGELALNDPEDATLLAERLRVWRSKLDYFREMTAPVASAIRHYTWDDMARDFLRVTLP